MNLVVNGKLVKQVENRYYHLFHNQLYMLLFFHDTTKVDYWTGNEAYFLETEAKYSILSLLNDSFKIGDHFQFLLDYPNNPPIIWRQTKNPIDEKTSDDTSQKVSGFQTVSSCDQHFTGLAQSTSSCLLDGSSEKTTEYSSWHYCIGLTSSQYPKPEILPGPYGTFTTQVALWVKFPIQPKYTCKQRGVPKLYASFVIILCLK